MFLPEVEEASDNIAVFHANLRYSLTHIIETEESEILKLNYQASMCSTSAILHKSKTLQYYKLI